MYYTNFTEKYEQMIETCATNEEVENIMFEQLAEIEDKLFELEMEINEQYDLKNMEDYPTDEELANDFNYLNRMV